MLTQVLPIVSAVLLSFGVSACTAETPSVDTSAAAPATPADGSDIGNGRPVVTFDGQLVRRRVVLALTGADASPAAVRPALERAASRFGMDLTDLPATVLDPGQLDESFPVLTVALPEGRTDTDGRALLGGTVETAALPADSVRLATVLVHDLAFRVTTEDPETVGRSVDAEGILSDVLGAYELEPGEEELAVGYTGPLLSDDSIDAVRVGMGRAAGTDPSDVEVLPRTTTGEGVRLSEVPPSSERSGHGQAMQASPRSVGPDTPVASFPLVAVGLAVAWVALLAGLGRWRARSAGSGEGRRRVG